MAELLTIALPLGESLYRQGTITKAQLASLLSRQERQGGRLGEIAVGEGMVGYREVHQALARQKRLSFVDLIAEPPDPSLLASISPEQCLALQAIPWRREEGGTVLVAVADPSPAALAWMHSIFGDLATPVITSPFDIRRAVERFFGAALAKKSRFSLWQQQPHASARVTIPVRSRQAWAAIAAAAIVATAWFPLHAALLFLVFCHLAYAVTMLFKCVAFAAGASAPSRLQETAAVPDIDERSLPIYTVLVPMYREAASVPGMLEAMRNLDYPAAKLDIKLVLEADDLETLAAVMACKPPGYFEIIRVPPCAPRTKPKACNYALQFARGEYVTIFDADDRPDPAQLKKAVAAFRLLPADVACLQATLNYYNANDNWLTRFFSLEYATLFQFILYGLDRLSMPIPLGGTSNHISLKRLREIGEWDPYNVTEDADLGLRLAARGLKTRMLDSYTMEEAPNRLYPWVRQRSRWIKGYMQTWLVHMRRPRALLRAVGWRGFIGVQCFMGLSCFTFLSAPLVWLLSFLWLAEIAEISQSLLPGWLGWLIAINMVLHIVTHWYISFYCAWDYRRHRARMLLAAAAYPLYPALHSIASYRALWQLFARPHFWEKTAHGLARRVESLGISLTEPAAVR